MKFRLTISISIFLFLTAFMHCQTAFSQGRPTVWDAIRKQFSLDHQVNRPEVQGQIRWLIEHPSYVNNLSESEPYIYHIVTEIKKRDMPGEIALIPMIESSYDPFAYSGAGAAGLWQLMPKTGADLGLKQDWWVDKRRSIRPATNAALNYLSYLYNFFQHDWVLAIAAYDTGEGKLARVIKQTHPSFHKVHFWSLPLPRETKVYIPRLLALAEIVANPQRYHIHLPDIPYTPYFQEVNIGSQIDLNHAAKLAGISYQDLIKLNPGYNRWATAPYSPYQLLIPTDRVDHFTRNLANVPKSKRISWTRHRVGSKDNLALIAKRYHTTVSLIKDINQLHSDYVNKGQYVLIPNNKNVLSLTTPTPIKHDPKPSFIAPKQYKILHIVQKNETYAQLEHKYNISSADIQSWNRLKSNEPLRNGQQLIIWKTIKAAIQYTIKNGDTLSAIAKQHHTSIKTIANLNPKLNPRLLRPGQQITMG